MLAVAAPLESVAVATMAFFAISTNCTPPVGVPAPGATAATLARSVTWPEAIAMETALLEAARETVTVNVLVVTLQVASPLYRTVIACVPAGSEFRRRVAVPEDSEAVPSCVPDASSTKVTWPVGAWKPAGTVALTLAVKTTVWPKTVAAGAADTVIVTGALTVWSNVAWAAGKMLLPLYRAVMSCEPPVSAEVVKTTGPFTTLTLPSAVVPSKNCTVPVANPDDGGWPLTPAVNVTAWPSADGLALLLNDTDDVGGEVTEAEVPPLTLPLPE
jgi:hypothetical protein